MVITTGCQHERTYWDVDEQKCHSCHRSLTFPQRPATEDDKVSTRLDVLANMGFNQRSFQPLENEPNEPDVPDVVACVSCHAKLSRPTPDGHGEITCKCGQILALVDADGNRRLPRPLPCLCCRELLPLDSFSARNNPAAKSREFRASYCRACMAFRSRVKRESDPEGARQRSRQYRQTFLANLTPEQQDAYRQQRAAQPKDAVNAAGRRYQARKHGKNVLKQRPGRAAILLKPVCRVFETCPLRPYCTTEGKGLA